MPRDALPTRPVKLRDYRYKGEVLSLFGTFVILLTIYVIFTFFFPTTWSQTVKALAITLAGLTVYVITVNFQQRAAFGTLVRVGPRQFPELNELAVEAAERLCTSQVPVYVKRSSEMQVYMLGFGGHPLIVLTSSLVDQMPPDALRFFIGREIGHVAAGHTWLRTLLKPLGSDVPIIGKLLNSVIFGDWLNRTEFTSDRAGFIACQSLTTAVSTMLKFGVGLRLYEKLDIREFLEQIHEVRNMSGHLTEIIAEQPYLTQRIRTLVRYSFSEQYRPLAPERKSNTQILKNLPEAFVSTGNLILEPTPEPAPEPAPEAEADADTPDSEAEAFLAQPTVRPAPVAAAAAAPAVREEAITVTDFTTQDDFTDNGPDPRMLLIPINGKKTYVLRRRCTRIGRNDDNDIVLKNDRTSRYHAEIVRQSGELTIIDKKSRNGVWLNGQRVDDSAPMRSGDTIRIGRDEFRLDLTGPLHQV